MRFKYQHPANDADFELLCLRLMQAEKANPQLQLHGRRGEKQHGRDIIDPTCRSPTWAAQCKLHEHGKAISRAEIESEVSKATTSFPVELQSFSILTTAKRSSAAQKVVAEINRRHQPAGLFQLELLTWDDLEVLLDRHNEIANEIYDSIGSRSLRQLKADIATILNRLPPSSDHVGPNKEQTAERRWQYIQSHPIRGIEILFMLKGAVGFDWFREILEETRLTFSRDEPSFKLGQLLAISHQPNTKEPSPKMEKAVCSFWELYKPEKGYWFKKIAPKPHVFSTVAGFDATAPWPVFGVKYAEKLQDIGMLTEVGISIPARAYQVGVEEFAFRFAGDTFSFWVRLSEHGLGFLHEMASTQHAVVKKAEPAPIGSVFNGVQLLEMFYRQLLPRLKNEESKREFGFGGISGPGGKAMSFYPMMPKGFMKTAESKEYTFTITVPGKIDTAARIKELEQKLKSNPDAKSYAELAALYSHIGQLQNAMHWLEIGMKQAPLDPDVHGMMAEILSENMGRFDDALMLYRKAEKLCPKDDARVTSFVQNGLGICLQNLGRHKEALPHFETAARIEPSKMSFQFNLSMAFSALERYSEALAPAQRAVELAPDDHRAAMHFGVLLTMANRTTEAIPHFERATQLSPKSADAHELLGQFLAKTNQHEHAVTSLQRAVKIEETARRYDLLGASLGVLDRWPEAESAFRCGVEIEPKNSGILANLGAAIANQRRLAEALEFFERAVSADPANVRAQQAVEQLLQLRVEDS